MAFICHEIGRKILAVRPQRLGVISNHLLPGRSCSSSSDTGDQNNPKSSPSDRKEQKRQAARIKLDELLTSIKKVVPVNETTGDGGGGVSDRLARPGGKPQSRFMIRGSQPPSAQRNRAALLREETAELSSEQKVEQVTHKEETKKKSRRRKKDEQVALHSLDEEVARAAREVASSLGGDTEQTERDLLSKLTGAGGAEAARGEADTEAKAASPLSELISGMRVTSQRQEPGAPEPRRGDRAELVRGQLGQGRSREIGQFRRSRGSRSLPASVDLNRGPALNIFPRAPSEETTEVSVPPPEGVWERVHRGELQLSVTYPPADAWQQMILWTEQGRLWTLPVDNEAGLEEEASVGFHEHVFLEGHLEPWCPRQGPIRNFMEIVCVALGKNPWLSLAEKHEHLAWFREYFDGKRELLQELKAM